MSLPPLKHRLRPRISLRIALGFGALVGAIVVLAIGGGLVLRDTIDAFDHFTDLSHQSAMVVDIERRVTDLQRRALAYTYSGYEGIPPRVQTLSQELHDQIGRAQQTVDDADEARLLRRMGEVFSLYDANFQLAVAERHDRDRWVKQGIEPISEFLTTQLKHWREQALEQGDTELGMRLSTALEQLLMAHQQGLAFESTPDSSLARAAESHLETLTELIESLSLNDFDKPATDQVELIKLFIHQYRTALLGMVQATRGYLYLVYVVLAGEAAELAELSRMLKERNLAQESQARQDVARKNQTARRIGLAVSVFAVLSAAVLAWAIARGITRPLRAVTDSLTELSLGHLDTPIPYQKRADEVGAIARATDIFRQTVDSKERAEAANRAKSQFLAHMSHELRTPLNAVLGFSQIMEQLPDTPADHRRYLSIINRSGAHLLAMINDILDMSKIESGRHTLDPAPCDLWQLLSDVESMFALRAEQQGIQFVLQRADNVPPVIRVDANKLRQIFINLLGNAVKFTREGSVTVQVEHLSGARAPQQTAQAAQTDSLAITITDTGCGIPPDRLESIFDPFTQVDGMSAGGTGLGLAICRRLITLFGGELGVASQLGKGSQFDFWIPCKTAALSDLNTANQNRIVVGLEAGQPCYRILIVEDNPNNRHLLLTVLAPLHLELREASNGAEAVNLVADWQPDLILMDIRMPVMDGREATKKIRESPTGQSCRVIAVTASSFDEERTEILAQGFDDFLSKPFQPVDIYRLLGQHLRLRFRYADWTQARPGSGLARGIPSASELSAEQVRELRAALIHGDPETIQSLLKTIEDDSPEVASQLRDWVSKYQYEHILHWLSNDDANNQPAT